MNSIATNLPGGKMQQTRYRQQRDPLGLPPDLSLFSPYRALEIAHHGLARARLSRDRQLIQEWEIAFDSAYTQCVLEGVLSE